MLTKEEARKKGIRACMEKIGWEFCLANEENSATAYGEDGGEMFCFVGINNNPCKDRNPDVLILSCCKGFPYYASCFVNMDDGNIKFSKYRAYEEKTCVFCP
jgi:hypothetical protein